MNGPSVALATLVGLALMSVGRGTCGEGGLRVVRVDALERVFPDKPPDPCEFVEPLSVPRDAHVAFQFALRASADLECEVAGIAPLRRDDGVELAGEAITYELVAVPVEANNNGGSKTQVGVTPRESWLKEFIRRAPFEVAEVLVPTRRLRLRAEVTGAVLVDVRVDAAAQPGVYRSALRVSAVGAVAEAPFSLRVHETIAPEQMALHSTHWFFPEPENLTNGERPDWWTERHWALLENSARQLRAFGQDTILTPLIDYEEPLIQTTRSADGTYSFDYSRFDRWMELFLGLGFRRFAGHHVAMLPEKWVYSGVFVFDEKTDKKERLVERGGGSEKWLAFIPLLYESLYAHLSEKGWTELYLQHQLDEPKDGALYRRLAGLARKHMPGVRTIDAINSKPAVFSPLVDVQVFALTILAKEQELAQQRRAEGKSVWLYHCCSPYPPYPNRHLDERLAYSRLYPWLAHLLRMGIYTGARISIGARTRTRRRWGLCPRARRRPAILRETTGSSIRARRDCWAPCGWWLSAMACWITRC